MRGHEAHATVEARSSAAAARLHGRAPAELVPNLISAVDVVDLALRGEGTRAMGAQARSRRRYRSARVA